MHCLFRILLIVYGITFTVGFSYAQPHTAQWPFYLAFEDATGARDTLWFLIDQEATVPNLFAPPYYDGNDAQFGEMPIQPDENSFHVYFDGIESIDGDGSVTYGKFDVLALPLVGSIWHSIYAENYLLPIIVSWDSFLLWYGLYPLGVYPTYGSLYNDYLWWNNLYYSTGTGAFNMMNSFNPSTIELPEFWGGPEAQFPLGFFVDYETIPPLSIDEHYQNNLKVYPNPVINELVIESEEPMVSVVILDLIGNEVLYHPFNGEKNLIHLDISFLPAGMYIARVDGRTNFSLVKILKN